MIFAIGGCVCYHAGMIELGSWMKGYLYFDRPPGEASSVDAIVVLGTSKRVDCFEKRITAALQYADRFPESSVIFSGKEPHKKKGILNESGDAYIESAIMAEEAISRGLDPERVSLESDSDNAQKNVFHSFDMVQESQSVLFVTSGFLGRRVDLYAQKYKRDNYFIVDTDVRDHMSRIEILSARERQKVLYEAPRILSYGLKGDL